MKDQFQIQTKSRGTLAQA